VQSPPTAAVHDKADRQISKPGRLWFLEGEYSIFLLFRQQEKLKRVQLSCLGVSMHCYFFVLQQEYITQI